MDWLQALVLGIIQGLTEYLPVSSSGHLAIGSALFGVQGEDNLTFTVMVHVATVLSTLVILWKEIDWILKGLFKFEMNAETKYFLNIVVSMIPVGIVGVFFKDYVEKIFGSGLLIVGCCLLLTAALLTFSYFAKPRQRENISMKDAFIIGLAQQPCCPVSHALVPPLPPASCSAIRRRNSHSSRSSWSSRPSSARHSSTCSRRLRAKKRSAI